MANIITSPPDLINLALARIGKPQFIGSIFEGSEASRIALRLYGQTRDEMLREDDYGFSERNTNLVLLKQAPVDGYFNAPWDGLVNPSPPWYFEYTYPSDCLKVRSIRPAPQFVLNFDPQPNVYSVENDNYFNPSRKVILCNVPNAQCVYTGQVTDPTVWESDFIDAFAARLGLRLAPALAGMDATKLEAADAAQARSIASSTEG